MANDSQYSMTGNWYLDAVLFPLSVSYAGIKAVENVASGVSDFFDTPEMPTVEAPPVIEQGEESVRRRTVTSELDRRQKAYYLTKGQPRDNATLAGYRETLGG